MKKMSISTEKRAKSLKLSVNNEEDLRKSLISLLDKNGIDGMDDEEIDTLLDIAESFLDDDDVKEDETVEDDLADDLADEEESVSKKPVIVKKPITKKPVIEEEPVTKKAVANKKPVEAETSAKRIRLNPKENVEDQEHFLIFRKLFPENEFFYNWIANAGVTIKHIGKNSQRAVVLIENCLKSDDSIKCNLYFLTFTKMTEVLEDAGVVYERCWTGAPFVKGISTTEAFELLKKFKGQILATVTKIDKKLGENRKKMEEDLNKKSITKKPVIEEVEEDEEEPAVKKPVIVKKPITKKPITKKPVIEEVEEDEE